jgi:sodium/potassium-transporting ATPase subunit alpha
MAGGKEAKSAKAKAEESEIDLEEHLLTIDEVCKKHRTNAETGLDPAEADRRNQTLGLNQLTPPPTVPLWLQFFHHLTGFFSLLLWLAAALCFIAYAIDDSSSDNLALGIVLAVVTLLTGIFSFYQDFKSQEVMAGFAKYTPKQANLVRGGRVVKVDAEKVTVGDKILIASGDYIPADVRVTKSSSLQVDNASLTGESDVQDRSPENSAKNPLHATNLIFFGTLCVKGTCEGIVVSIGDETVIGKIADLVKTTDVKDTPIAIEIEHFIHIVSGVAAFLGITFLIIGFAIGTDPIDNLVFAIGIIVANVPEGLLATVTVSLTLTAQRMAKKNVLVKNLESVETLGSTTVIASDKTGTLTMNRMTVLHLHYDGKTVLAKGEGPGCKNKDDDTFQKLQMIMTLCCNAKFLPKIVNGREIPKSQMKDAELDSREVKGDASEAAFIKYTDRIYDIEDYRNKFPRIHELPFNSANKFMATIHLQEEKKDMHRLLLMKGGAEVVLQRCGYIMINGHPEKLTAERRADYNRAMLNLMDNGERVLACCMTTLDPAKFPYDPENKGDPTKHFEYINSMEDTKEPNFPIHLWPEPKNLDDAPPMVMVGMVALIDPPREAVPNAVKECQSAGVKVVMVTGDHRATATAIARNVHIIRGNTIADLAKHRKCAVEDINPDDPEIDAVVVTGDELKVMSDQDLDRILDYDQIVFARTSPTQKLIIVEGLQNKKYVRRGRPAHKPLRVKHVVAVTGDGVNDSPALKTADIGVAMNITGTEVAKNAADMILLDDNFASIVNGVEEGRLIFDNLKKSIAYTLSSNIPEISPFLVFIITSVPLPLPTVLILCIDLGTDMVPAISLAYENAEADIMAKPPRDMNTERLVTGKLVNFSYLQIGVVQALAGFFCYFVVLYDYGFHPNDLYGAHEDFKLENVGPCVGREGTCLVGDDVSFRLLDCQVSGKPCHDPEEALKHAQTAYFISIIVVQWADLVCCKTRTLSLANQGMRNGTLNFGLFFETALGAALCYIDALNGLGTRPLAFVHWLPAMPFSMFILCYDEVRKYLMRTLPKGNWVFRNTYY